VRLWFKTRKQRELERQERELDELRQKAARNGAMTVGYKSTFALGTDVPSVAGIEVSDQPIPWETLPSREAAMFNKGGS